MKNEGKNKGDAKQLGVLSQFSAKCFRITIKILAQLL
jgi:hypothetical protein